MLNQAPPVPLHPIHTPPPLPTFWAVHLGPSGVQISPFPEFPTPSSPRFPPLWAVHLGPSEVRTFPSQSYPLSIPQTRAVPGRPDRPCRTVGLEAHDTSLNLFLYDLPSPISGQREREHATPQGGGKKKNPFSPLRP